MKADILADLMAAQAQAPQQSADIGYHTGVVVSWDPISGANTVDINGQQFVNLRVLSSGPGVLFASNDTVVLMRIKTTYFILGRVAAPGAGAALAMRTAFAANTGTLSAGGINVWRDLSTGDTSGPVLSDVYISSACRALVILSAYMEVGGDTSGMMGFEITGASTIPANYYRAIRLSHFTFDPDYDNNIGASVSSTFVIDKTILPGLNSGMNTFTAKYTRYSGDGFITFDRRHLTVIPY
ncbi:hypothetical protein [Amycolatopsis sp. YIM 10]|uniref:hypothetical protein n=1 Tax=Amycolatopsis sp. YIM 10 TaxID=2653857 RepID=UPI00128FF87E|nr:hypothetical protein [Amycolatopsis sp. YIM 10]QFU87886.1 hypothetical protein YIM_13500 [Amycolatopsis sp. YIM 10]QFU94801.1 hypothetical protein YIM_48380 [Amycolatopsis sp. YIM 10]